MAFDGVARSGTRSQGVYGQRLEPFECLFWFADTVDGAVDHDVLSTKPFNGGFDQVEVQIEVAVKSANQYCSSAFGQAPFRVFQDDFTLRSRVDQMAFAGPHGHGDRQVCGFDAVSDDAWGRGDSAGGVATGNFDARGPTACGPCHISRRAADDLKIKRLVHSLMPRYALRPAANDEAGNRAGFVVGQGLELFGSAEGALLLDAGRFTRQAAQVVDARTAHFTTLHHFNSLQEGA